MNSRFRLGVGLVEICVVAVCLGIILTGLLRFFQAGRTSSQRSMEIVDQTRVATLLLAHMEDDFTGILSWPATTTYSDVVGTSPDSSSGQQGKDFLFWTVANGHFRPVRYSFDPGLKEVRRFEGMPGTNEESQKYGTGFFLDFSLEEMPGLPGCFRGTLCFKGKSATRTFTRIFSGGFVPVASAARPWIFSWKP